MQGRLIRWLSVGALGLTGSCADDLRHPPGYTVPPEEQQDAGVVIDTGVGPPGLDEAGYCGNQLIETQREEKNLYFVIDRSGSMQAELPGVGLNRYDAMREAIASVLREVGHRVSYGVAIFPGAPLGNGCTPGLEVFPVQPGDPALYAATGTTGPVLAQLLNGLASYRPDGGTPCSPTLVELMPTLTGLTGETFVVLATDGHPNCNPNATCSREDCYPNRFGGTLANGTPCDETTNCCSPELRDQGGGPELCIDGLDSVSAVAALHAAGIATYVIGLPDSEEFTSVLNELATAGGTAREGEDVAFYPVEDAAALGSQLRAIGAAVAIDCELTLDAAPPDPDLVNVYLDIEVLPQDAAEGWTFTSPTTLSIRGEACRRLESGDVLNVQIVAGCPTEIH